MGHNEYDALGLELLEVSSFYIDFSYQIYMNTILSRKQPG